MVLFGNISQLWSYSLKIEMACFAELSHMLMCFKTGYMQNGVFWDTLFARGIQIWSSQPDYLKICAVLDTASGNE